MVCSNDELNGPGVVRANTPHTVKCDEFHIRAVRGGTKRIGPKGNRILHNRTLCGQWVRPPEVIRVDKLSDSPLPICSKCQSKINKRSK